MTTTQIITEQQNQVEELEMLTRHHLELIKQLNQIIDNQRGQIECLQQTADSSVIAINKMSRIIAGQNERINQLKARVNQLTKGQFFQNEN